MNRLLGPCPRIVTYYEKAIFGYISPQFSSNGATIRLKFMKNLAQISFLSLRLIFSDKLLVVLVLISVTSCSNKVMYDNLRLNQRQNCAEKPRATYIECIEHTNKSYEDYERERKELLGTSFLMKNP